MPRPHADITKAAAYVLPLPFKTMRRTMLFFIALVGTLTACRHNTEVAIPAKHLHAWNVAYEQAIVNDFFSPPVAGRMYTYPNLISYAILNQAEGDLLAQLKNFPKLPNWKDEDRELVALYSFYAIGKKMVYSYNFLDEHLAVFESEMQALGFSKNELEQAKLKATKWSERFTEWVLADGYRESRSDTKYALKKKPGTWKPTSPDFADALEPNWEKIRPFFIDSAIQFTHKYKPYPFDMGAGSKFYEELLEVKTQVDKTNEEELATSKYWDCNPLAPQHKSHASYAEKKLTPGGHWMSITRNVSIDKEENLQRASRAYALVSLSIHDGFIACWQAKYHYDYIRPITAIQENWNSKWATLINTPNFPEYPSGHSVISGVASTILAAHYGDETIFTDNAEEPFGMKPRKFLSFTQACDQAAMSRFYAGIHYKKAIVDGVEMGREIGQHILAKLKLDGSNE